MTTVISGTNRKNSGTGKIARTYYKLLKEKEPEAKFFSLEELPEDFVYPDMYSDRKTEASYRLSVIEHEVLEPSDKFVFIVPEYNGSFPGVLKTFIDATNIPQSYKNKKAAILGISTGRQGNLRGMEHLTGILNHMGVTVMPNRLPVSKINEEFSRDGEIKSELTADAFKKHIDEIVKF